jgi:hypothetical protein
MLKRVLVKTVMKYKTTLIMLLVLIIILCSILNREQVKVVENISDLRDSKLFQSEKNELYDAVTAINANVKKVN